MCKCTLCTEAYAGQIDKCPVCKDWGHYRDSLLDRMVIVDEMRIEQWMLSARINSLMQVLEEATWALRNEGELIRRDHLHQLKSLKDEFQEVRQMAINAAVPKNVTKINEPKSAERKVITE